MLISATITKELQFLFDGLLGTISSSYIALFWHCVFPLFFPLKNSTYRPACVEHSLCQIFYHIES